MPVTIISEEQKKLEEASGITLLDIQTMVNKHRTKNKHSFKWSHFQVFEILELLIGNKIIKGSDTVDHIIANTKNKYGIKIFLGDHTELTIPPRRTDYIDKTSTILCTTEWRLGNKEDVGVGDLKTEKWINILKVGAKISGPGDYEGGGEDRTVICKPDCGMGNDVL